MKQAPEGLVLLKETLGDRLCLDRPLAPLTSLKIGGRAEYWALVRDLIELKQIQRFAKKNFLKMRVLGEGTNLVVQSGLLKGVTVKLDGAFRRIKTKEHIVRAGGGCPLSHVVREAVRNNLIGVEGIAGIPGSLGGGIIMNAGTNLGCLGDLCEEVNIISAEGTIIKRTAKEMCFSYRGCGLEEEEVVFAAELRLIKGLEVKSAIRDALKKRFDSQPYREKSAGCVFRNPEGLSAGELIDKEGLKGYRCGGIEVSQKHANFFINQGDGTPEDFFRLMDIVRNRVLNAFGVELRPEVKVWVN